MAKDLEKTWFTTEEAENITGYDSRSFTRRIREGKIKNYKKEGKNYLIHKDVIQEYIQEKELIESNYISYKDTASLLGKKLKTIQELASQGVFTDTRKFGVNSYISKTEVEKHLRRMMTTISTTEVSEITGLSWRDISLLIKRDVLVAEQVNNYLWYVDKNSFHNFIEEIRQGYTVDDICSELNIDQQEVKRFVEIDWLKMYDIKGLGLRTRKDDYKSFIDKKEKLYSVQDICKEFDLKPGVVRSSIILKGLVNGYLENNQLYVVPKEEMKRFASTLEGIRLIHFGKEDYYKYFSEFTDALYKLTKYKDTVGLYKIWAKEKINKSKANYKKNFVNFLTRTIENLNNALSKEIYKYNDKELDILFKDESVKLTAKDIEIISGFLVYCKRKRECSFTDAYSINSIIDKKKSIDKIIYSKIDWVTYCTHLTDMDKHKKKAIEKRRYAETWLFMLLHLSLAWRSSDIIKMPNVALELVNINDFDWFENNDFNLQIAQDIINNVRRRSIGINTDKTGAKTHFVIGLTVPTALAFVICELHRRKSSKNNESLLSLKRYRTADFRMVLGDGIPMFSSLKCNRTLLTYLFETAVNTEGKAHIAYQLSSYARSHKYYLDRPNDITSVYLITTNTDASVENMAVHLFERGFFGWQIGLMLNLIYNTDEWNFQDKTEMIKSFNETLYPIAVESISEYANTRHEEAKSLLNELMVLPIEKLKQKLEDIAQFKSPALIEYSQCIKGLKNCPYNKSTACLGCKYLIPTNYILEIVNVDLLDLLERLDQTPMSEKAKRIKYTHMINRLMFILLDFKRAYMNFDSNYIQSFINLDIIKEKYQRLEFTKFFSIKG